MLRGYELYEQLKDAVNPELILEEMVRIIPDDKLYDILKQVKINFDIDI